MPASSIEKVPSADRHTQAAVADLAAAIERAAADIGLAEEPSAFITALEVWRGPRKGRQKRPRRRVQPVPSGRARSDA